MATRRKKPIAVIGDRVKCTQRVYGVCTVGSIYKIVPTPEGYREKKSVVWITSDGEWPWDLSVEAFKDYFVVVPPIKRNLPEWW